ncbi:unnamed protein product, partial [Allacma fusca]
MDELMEKLCNMEKKLAKLDDIEKRMDKIDDIQEKMKRLIASNNSINNIMKNHSSQIANLETLTKSHNEEISELKTQLFQADNNKNFAQSDRSGNLIVRGLSAPLRSSHNSANSIIKTELITKICDSADQEQDVLKWFDVE